MSAAFVPILMALINAHVIQDSSFIQIDHLVWVGHSIFLIIGRGGGGQIRE